MNKKDLKRVKKQSAARMQQLAAAFKDETGLVASETAIHQTVQLDPDTKQPTYISWFAPLHYDPTTWHPDIGKAFDLLTAASNANKAGEFDKIRDEFFSEIEDLAGKYTDKG